MRASDFDILVVIDEKLQPTLYTLLVQHYYNTSKNPNHDEVMAEAERMASRYIDQLVMISDLTRE